MCHETITTHYPYRYWVAKYLVSMRSSDVFTDVRNEWIIGQDRMHMRFAISGGHLQGIMC